MLLRKYSFASLLPVLTCISLSAIAQGTVPSQTSAAASSSVPGAVTVQVQPAPPLQIPVKAPSGTVTLYNGTNAAGSPATLTAAGAFTSASFAKIFGTPDPALVSAVGSGPVALGSNSGAVWGDFKEDGKPDLLVYAGLPPSGGLAQQQNTLLQVFASNAATTSASSITSVQSYVPLPVQQFTLSAPRRLAISMQVLDVDGDGHLDVLLGNTVAYGNGDGTFGRVAVLPVLASGFDQTYAVDVNGDGKVDIVAVNTPPPATGDSSAPPVQFTLTVFKNEGSGTFTSLGAFPLAASFQPGVNLCCSAFNIFGLFFADVNGDGKLDVLSESNGVPQTAGGASGNNLNLMLNNGNGTFNTPRPIDTTGITSLDYDVAAFRDLNGDGKQDLVLSYKTNEGNNAVATLLGAGDGTFAAPAVLSIGFPTTLGNQLLPFVAEDVNADGKVDVVLGNGLLAMGNGDGSLTFGTPLFPNNIGFTNPPADYLLSSPPAEAVISNAANDPLTSIFFLNLQDTTDALFVPQVAAGANATASLPPGTYVLTAHYSGDSTYAPSTSPSFNLTVAPATSTVTLSASPATIYAGEDVTLQAGVAGYPNPTGTVTFSDGSAIIGTATVSNGTANFSTSFTLSGNHAITAAYGGDANDAASNATLTVNVLAPVSVAVGGGAATSLTVVAGQSASAILTVAGNAGFSGPITFSCTGLPTYASCSFSPASLSISGTAAGTTTLTVATGGTPMAALQMSTSARPYAIAACMLPLLGLVGLLPAERRRRGLLCAGLFLLAPLAALQGCGGGGGHTAAGASTAPGSYGFNIVAASATASTSTAAKLTVQ